MKIILYQTTMRVSFAKPSQTIKELKLGASPIAEFQGCDLFVLRLGNSLETLGGLTQQIKVKDIRTVRGIFFLVLGLTRKVCQHNTFRQSSCH